MRSIGFGSRWGLVALALLAMAGPARGQQESWDAVFIAGSKVGSMRTRVEPVKDGDRDLVRVRVNFDLAFRRGKDNVAIELEYGTIETPDGQILRLDTRTHASNQTIRVHGDVVDGKMNLKIESGGPRQEKVIAWAPDVRGPYGPELSFSKKPMQPGEVRSLRTFVPELNKIVVDTLNARRLEPITLGGDTVRDLLRVDREVSGEDGKRMPEMDQTFWVDAGGQVLRSYNDNFGGMTTYRTTREAATRQVASAQRLDLIGTSVVKITKPIGSPESSRNVVYKLTMPDVDPATLFPVDRRQSVKRGDGPNSILLEVKTAGPIDGVAGPEAVDAEYLRSNPLITSDDARVVALSRRAVGAAVDPWAKAQAINKWVATNIKDKNFETSFAPADEVARTLAGDCTEHGVLTAAMCRAQGIPARVVVGLIYVPHLGGFGFHMWDEVYINRRWVAIDAAYDQTVVDAVHIKLAETSLDGVSPFESFTAVVRVANKLKLEAVEVR